MGWGGAESGIFAPILHGFVLLYSRLRKNFIVPSSPLGAPRSPTLSHKILLLINFPITITIFLNKTYFINKNILEIANKFIPPNQTNF